MATTQLQIVNLSITSDSICPFCYLGLRKVDKAIDLAKKEGLPLKFVTKFEPYQLDPTLPVDHPVNKRERYEDRFGGKERVAAMEKMMKDRGHQVEPPIEFSYGGSVRQTIDSHRLIAKAHHIGGEDTQRKLVEALFKGYFTEEKDIGSHEFLSQAAESCGVMSKEEAIKFLSTDEMRSEVERGIHRARKLGISGVPFFIINGKYGVSGAQESETFLNIFRALAEGKEL